MYNSETKSYFNDSIGYLRMLAELRWSCHIHAGNNDYYNWLLACEEYHNELYPRMVDKKINKKDQKTVEIIADNFRKEAQKSINSNSTDRRLRLREYFRYLNYFAHKEGLIMKDEDSMPGVIRNR